ncbi:hypothetical protein CLIB1423_09S04038 [[Candida] railenensis]|uniref:Uncharacterized protein n=1 Tax=[Candida] railenensis TaxID=45579 RepID=A0A9P0QRB4_9ASCO|nr:hypothetical protein CLIB1423_09S04038 [[Candida] railenensis]
MRKKKKIGISKMEHLRRDHTLDQLPKTTLCHISYEHCVSEFGESCVSEVACDRMDGCAVHCAMIKKTSFGKSATLNSGKMVSKLELCLTNEAAAQSPNSKLRCPKRNLSDWLTIFRTEQILCHSD